MDPMTFKVMIFIILMTVICMLYAIYIRYKNKNKEKKANDVSELSLTSIKSNIYISSKEDIFTSINLARLNETSIGICGAKHSMGGHSIAEDGYRLDMNKYNKIIYHDVLNNEITVEPGIKWCELIKYLNDFGESPATLQSYSTFSVGGTISVNAHGITNDNVIGESIRSLKVIISNGKEIYCDRETQSDLFSLVIGGYGLFGVISEVTLQTVKNVNLEVKKYDLDVRTFREVYEKVLEDGDVNVKLARINLGDVNNIQLYTFSNKNKKNKISNLSKHPNEMSKTTQFMYKWMLPMRCFHSLKFFIESKMSLPMDMSHENVDRNQLLYESAEPLAKLYNVLIDLNKTHILQEYFIPKHNFEKWMLYLKYFINKITVSKISLLNITIRYIKKDTVSYLKYAKEDYYAFVFYYRMDKSDKYDKELKNMHMNLVNEVIKLGGTFYLPYRHHYTKNQLITCYPEIINFIKQKKHIDKNNMFSNVWFDYICKLVEN
jgi:hypothetical protein